MSLVAVLRYMAVPADCLRFEWFTRELCATHGMPAPLDGRGTIPRPTNLDELRVLAGCFGDATATFADWVAVALWHQSKPEYARDPRKAAKVSAAIWHFAFQDAAKAGFPTKKVKKVQERALGRKALTTIRFRALDARARCTVEGHPRLLDGISSAMERLALTLMPDHYKMDDDILELLK